MSKALTQLVVFVSGTSETSAERAALRSVAEELNKQTEGSFSITFKVVTWPEDIYPGVGSDPQSVINGQLGVNYDIYVGLLGTRFGSSTPRYGSGTEEEFNVALEKFVNDSKSVRLLFYFKSSASDIFAVDADQLELVKKFRSGLSSRGVLFRDFKDTTEFVKQVRDHLWQLVTNEWNKDSWKFVDLSTNVVRSIEDKVSLQGETEEMEISKTKSDLIKTDELEVAKEETSNIAGFGSDEMALDDFGILDHVSEFHRSATALYNILENIALSTNEIAAKTIERTEEMRKLQQERELSIEAKGDRSQHAFFVTAKKLVDLVAGDLNLFSNELAPNISNYHSEIRIMLNSFLGSMEMGAEMGNIDAVNRNRDQFSQMLMVIESTRLQITDFQETIRGLPPLTTNFKRARNRTTSSLGQFIAEISFSINEGRNILDKLHKSTSKIEK